MLRDPDSRLRGLWRESETSAAHYTTIGMNAIVFVAVCLFAGFFLGEFLRLTTAGTTALHRIFEATR